MVIRVLLILLLLLSSASADWPTPPAKVVIEEYKEQKDPVSVALQYVGERETHGNNRSPYIDSLAEFTGHKPGIPYCAAFLAYVFHEAGVTAPRSAWSPDWVKTNNITYSQIARNSVVGLFFPSKGRIAHVLLIEARKGNYWQTIEGNTSPQSGELSESSRNGDGIFKRLRPDYSIKNKRNKYSHYY